MRGAATIKKPLPATEQEAAMALRSTSNGDELATVWWRDCDAFAGAARERLQDIYTRQLRSFGAMQG